MSKQQTIFRIHKEDGQFFLMHKGIVNDENLSLKAKGIMAYLLSKPDDWTVYLADIVKRSSDGKAAVRSGIKELEDAGYIQKSQARDEDGQFEAVVWHVYEQPVTAYRLSETGKPETGKSDTTNNKGTKNKENKNNKQTLVDSWELAIGTLLTPTEMHLLYDMGLDWDAHTSGLPEEHPDKGRRGNEVVREAIKITGMNGVRKINYTAAIVKGWMNDGYMVDTRKSNKQQTKVRRNKDGSIYG